MGDDRSEFWRRAISNGLIEIPKQECWISKRMSYKELARKLNSDISTPAMIAIDSYEHLPSYLKELDCSVLRLGSHRQHTDFILCKPTGGCKNMYIFDDEVFRSIHPVKNIRKIEAFSVLRYIERLDEGSGLGIFNMIFPYELIFNSIYEYETLAFFPYRTNHTFKFFIDKDLGPIEHINGQIEVDSIVIIKHSDTKAIVIEAKYGEKSSSIGKHKILYSTMVARSLLTDNIEIIPAYLRIMDDGDDIKFQFCTLRMEYEGELPILVSLSPCNSYLIDIKRGKDYYTN